MRTHAPLPLIVCSLVIAGAGIGLNATPRQVLAGVQANWADLETWSHVIDSSRENELGLGLQTTGSNGTMFVAFLGRLSMSSPTTPPADVHVQVAASLLANPRAIRAPTLIFMADAAEEHPMTIDISARLLTDVSSPGGILQNGVSSMPAAGFARLTQAKTLTGNVLGSDVVFRPDQVRAMQAFATRLHVPQPPPLK